jgi:hypothetical protein
MPIELTHYFGFRKWVTIVNCVVDGGRMVHQSRTIGAGDDSVYIPANVKNDLAPVWPLVPQGDTQLSE